MLSDPVIPILTSPNLLRLYAKGRADKITPKLLARECQTRLWAESPGLPDHMLHNVRDCALGRIGNIATLLCDSLDWLTRSTLIWRGDRLEVSEAEFERWQLIITQVSPLALQAWKIAQKVFEDALSASATRKLIRRNITENVFPSFSDPLLEDKFKQIGLCDLHVHLNGSTASDLVWLDALACPKKFRLELIGQQREQRENVEELFLQASPFFDWKDCGCLVDIACRLRDWLVRRVFSPSTCPIVLDDAVGACRDDCRLRLRKENSYSPGECPQRRWERRIFADSRLGRYMLHGTVSSPLIIRGGHPLKAYFPSETNGYDLPGQWEAIFLVRLFEQLHEIGNEIVAKFAHYYLLIQSFFTRVLVQQASQSGFDQFQKITQTGIREYSEKNYANRLRQFSSAAGAASIYVEGRFAPKKSSKEDLSLLRQIERGYALFLQGEHERGYPFSKDWRRRVRERQRAYLGGWSRPIAEEENVRRSHLQLALVAHFIKKRDTEIYAGCQHYVLRRSLERQARELLRSMSITRERNLIVGFDAAANELHTPPEVFAPVFRMLRRAGQNNFTFHVGEDFRHLVSGIRAVDEAVNFLELSAGSRIGHGTALGIDPKLWKQRVGPTIWMLKPEWLDDLVYAYHYLQGNAETLPDAVRAADDICRLSEQVYGEPCQPQCLWDAWKLRSLDPIRCFVERDSHFYFSLQDKEEWDRIRKAKDGGKKAYELFLNYHRAKIFFKYNPMSKQKDDLKRMYEEVDTKFFSDESLSYLQNRILQELKEKKIAIESILSSNVRISFYNSYKEHHIIRWLNLRSEEFNKLMPLVCLGTDDPGIFATTIKNEYIHLLQIMQEFVPYGEAVDNIAKIMEHSLSLRFRTNNENII